jgi:hypothetical protein
MIKSSRNARRIIQARRDAAKAHRQGLHTLASHARLAGVFDNDTSAVGGALRAKAKQCGISGHRATMVRKTDSGVRYVRHARRYSVAEVAELASAYRPRVAKFALARRQLLAYAAS